MSRRAPGALLVLLAGALALTGCSLLPDSGDVHVQPTVANATAPEAPSFDPPGPTPGARPAEVVQGFLTAMRANPVSDAAARPFLTRQAAASWRPDDGTIVYDAAAVEAHRNVVTARLSDAHGLDARGSWSPTATRTETQRLRLVREGGEWRIDNPVNALLIRSSDFQDQFLPYNLYFFDHSGRVLVPQPVYIPRGQQTATRLVRGLLRGPSAALAAVVRTSFPATTELDLSVLVTDSGVAEVPLGPEVLKLSPDELNRAMAQLAWTLRPVTGIRRVRITVDGTPVSLPDGRTDLSVSEGAEFAPSGLGASRELIGIRDGRVVTVTGGTAEPVAGPLGRRGFALRSVALNRSGDALAAVSQDGTRLYLGETPSGSDETVRRLVRGHDLLRPAFDLYGDLWVIDRTGAGAVVHVVRGRHDRVVRFPGISGAQLSSFAISPDGTRLAVGVTDKLVPRVLVATVQRGPDGQVQHGLPAAALPVPSYDPEHELGPVIDVGWRHPTVLAVLTRPSPTVSRVVYAMSDGSPGDLGGSLPDAFAQPATSLVVNSDAGLPLILLDAKGRLSRLDAAGKWEGTGATRLTAVAYAG
jgi:hypothetical protein